MNQIFENLDNNPHALAAWAVCCAVMFVLAVVMEKQFEK